MALNIEYSFIFLIFYIVLLLLIDVLVMAGIQTRLLSGIFFYLLIEYYFIQMHDPAVIKNLHINTSFSDFDSNPILSSITTLFAIQGPSIMATLILSSFYLSKLSMTSKFKHKT